MPAWVWIVIALVVVVAAVAGWVAWKRTRTSHLKETFGPEYDRTVAESPSQREGEAALDDRRKRRDELEIRPLTPEACRRYDEEWRAVQARFVAVLRVRIASGCLALTLGITRSAVARCILGGGRSQTGCR